MRTEKLDLRREMKARRAALSGAEAAQRSARACRALLSTPSVFPPDAVVAGYVAVRGELDPAPLLAALRARGCRTLVPRLGAASVSAGSALEMVAIDDGTPLAATGALAIPEPSADLPPTPLERVDLFLLPALAFDGSGGRLGWGRGHYDATLRAAPRALRVLLAFEVQRVDSVPRDAHDEPCDVVATESGVSWTGARGRGGPGAWS